MRIKVAITIGTMIALFSMSVYLYDQMYDCLNPPLWIKIPRIYGVDDCLQKYVDGSLPDWSVERERYAVQQEHRAKMIELFSEIPQVVAFYDKYNDDVNVSVRDDHVSYFTSEENEFYLRMNLYYNQTNDNTHMRFYCVNGEIIQNEIAQEDILSYIQNNNNDDCKSKDILQSHNITESKSSLGVNSVISSIVVIPLGAVIEGHEHLIPKEITIVLGKNNTVTWINEDDTYHSFVSNKGGEGSWWTGPLKPGESSSVTFNHTGIFPYHGMPGPWMTGKVIVLADQ